MKQKELEIEKSIASWQERKLIKESTNWESLKQVILEKRAVYWGIDPTIATLHLGHLVPLQLLKEIGALGCQPIIIIGTVTAQIGDPSFSQNKRKTLTAKQAVANKEKLQQEIKQLIPQALFLDNKMWYQKTTLLSFLKEIGNQFTVNKILEKKSLSQALESQNLFFSQFAYLLLQAYDFYHLYHHYNCYLQIGGSDQFPNIVIGIDLIRKKNQTHKVVCGLTTPLLTDLKGIKFSKSNRTGIWLASAKTTLYQIYQFCYNLDDQTAHHWAKIFLNQKNSFISKPNDKERKVQQMLFNYFITWWKGQEALEKFQEKMIILKQREELNPKNYQQLEAILPKLIVKQEDISLIHLLLVTKVASSKREARYLIAHNAIKINHQIFNKESQFSTFINQKERNHLLLEKGKKELFLIKIK